MGKKIMTGEALYTMLNNASFKKGFTSGATVKGLDPKTMASAEMLLFKLAKYTDIKSFAQFVETHKLGDIVLPLNPKEMELIKGGFWGAFLRVCFDFGIGYGYENNNKKWT